MIVAVLGGLQVISVIRPVGFAASFPPVRNFGVWDTEYWTVSDYGRGEGVEGDAVDIGRVDSGETASNRNTHDRLLAGSDDDQSFAAYLDVWARHPWPTDGDCVRRNRQATLAVALAVLHSGRRRFRRQVLGINQMDARTSTEAGRNSAEDVARLSGCLGQLLLGALLKSSSL